MGSHAEVKGNAMSKFGLKLPFVMFWFNGFIGRCSKDEYLLFSVAAVAGRGKWL